MNRIFFKLVNKVYLNNVLTFLNVKLKDFEKLNHSINVNVNSYEIIDFTSLDNVKQNTLSFISKN